MASEKKQRLRTFMDTLGRVACALIGGVAGLIIGLVLSVILLSGGSGWTLTLIVAGAGCVAGAVSCAIYTNLAEFALQIVMGVVEFILAIIKAIASVLGAI